MFSDILSSIPFTIIAGLFFAIMLFLKVKIHEPFVQSKIAKRVVLAFSVVFLFGGLISIVVFLIRESDWYKIDLSIAFLILGIALSGLISETSRDPNDSVL